MAKKKTGDTKEKLSKEQKNELATVSEVLGHYQDAQGELSTRISHGERGFDVYDRLYRNFINKAKWPFNARVPDGRGATLLKRKTDRLLANKMQGVMNPTKYGSELGGKIATELVLHDWNAIDMHTDEPMLIRWRRMDQSTRKYGAGFGFVGWKKCRNYEGPDFEPLDNRDVLLQPGAKGIDDCDWVQVRRYPTIYQLEELNTKSSSGELYSKKAIANLKKMAKGRGDNAGQNYSSINKEVVGLDNTSAKERVEVVTEYRPDRWITFAPKKGGKEVMILRDIPNPYKHQQIPIIRLVYDVIDDDIYGVPELEAVTPLLKSSWALLSQYLEAIQNELYGPLQMNPTSVQLDTIKYKAGARWLMNRPGADVVPFQFGTMGMQKFQTTFGIITSLIMEGVGETAQDVSNFGQGFTDKTATEVRDMAMLRTSRDNSNKLLLKQAMAKMVYFWFEMDKQFLSGDKMIRIVGREALKYLMKEGLHGYTMSQEGLELVYAYCDENKVDWDTAYNELHSLGKLDEFMSPTYGIKQDGEQVPKLQVEEGGKAGFLAVNSKDLDGTYEFVPDIEAMSLPDDQSDVMARGNVAELMLKVKADIAKEGYTFKWKEFMEAMGEKARLKDMEQYFEKIPVQTPPAGQDIMNNEATPTGESMPGAEELGNPMPGQMPMPPEVAQALNNNPQANAGTQPRGLGPTGPGQIG